MNEEEDGTLLGSRKGSLTSVFVDLACIESNRGMFEIDFVYRPCWWWCAKMMARLSCRREDEIHSDLEILIPGLLISISLMPSR